MSCAARWEKKIRKRWRSQREKFRQGALKNGIDEATSMLIFDKIEKFASYGFNKSHAAAYGYLELCHRLFQGQLSERVDGCAHDL